MLIRKISVIMISLAIVLVSAFSQESPKKAEKPHDPMYKILVRFPVNVSKKYIYNENSKITRVFSNGNEQNFTRDMTYHFSLRAPSAVDKQGFQMIEVSVDSLEYKYTSKDTTIYFNDQRDDLRPPKLDDYQNRMVQLGLDFQMTYSPYQEVAKVHGDMLLDKRKYLTDPATAPQDELNKASWMNGLSDETLVNLFDVVKGFPPQHKIDVDSSWSKEILCEIEGGRFLDSVTFTLTNFNIQSYTFKGVSNNFIPVESLVRLFGLSQLIDFTDAEGTSEYTIKMHPRGSINSLEAKYNILLTYQVANDFIQQKVEITKTWTLDKMYNW
ncbi:MAG: hypothetical protein KIT33_11380 [Candidatus Kapabacteria bacterium]|nr:hypothetical protein [Ignavibacteriota bacterium]MCW5885560.1 hypothetical protein [Candidatus Kapabacteria bacterium]